MPGKWLFFRKVTFRDVESRFSWISRAVHFAWVPMGESLPFWRGVPEDVRWGHFLQENELLFTLFCVQKSVKSMNVLMYKKGCIVADF